MTAPRTVRTSHKDNASRGTESLCRPCWITPTPRLRTARLIRLVLLCHKFRRCLRDNRRMHNCDRRRVIAIATANKRWMVAIELGTWRCGRIGGAAGSVTSGKGRFFDRSGAMRCWGGNPLSFGDQEAIGCDRQRAVMMEAPPSAALIVAEADFLFEFLIVALDAPAQLGEVDESAERHALVDGCEPEFCRRSFILRPFDKQRLFGETRFAPHRGGVHAHAGKARPQFRVAAFPPRDGAPGVLWKAARQCFDTDAPRLPIILAHRTHFDRRYHGRHIFQSKYPNRLAQGAVRR